MGPFSRCVVVVLATVALAGGVHAQQDMSGTTPPTQVDMTATLRAAPAGLAIVNTLLSTNVPGGFGFATTNTSGLLIANLVVTENQNQTQTSPN
jgi:hypothetical protein